MLSSETASFYSRYPQSFDDACRTAGGDDAANGRQRHSYIPTLRRALEEKPALLAELGLVRQPEAKLAAVHGANTADLATSMELLLRQGQTTEGRIAKQAELACVA